MLLALPLAAAGGQARDGAVIVAERFDPVTDSFRPVVVSPIPAPAVSAIQLALDRAGFPPPQLSGVLDFGTRSALRAFQAARGLRISGYPDYPTVVALGVPVRPGVRVGVAETSDVALLRRTPGLIIIGSSRDSTAVGGVVRGGRIGAPTAPAPRPASPPGVGPAPSPEPAPPRVPGAGGGPAPPPAGAPSGPTGAGRQTGAGPAGAS